MKFDRDTKIKVSTTPISKFKDDLPSPIAINKENTLKKPLNKIQKDYLTEMREASENYRRKVKLY